MNCPCGGLVVRKTNRTHGNYFYGCDKYPACRNTWPADREGNFAGEDPGLKGLHAQVSQSIGAALKQGLVKGGVKGVLCKVLGLDPKGNDHFVWKLSEEQCRKVLKHLGEG